MIAKSVEKILQTDKGWHVYNVTYNVILPITENINLLNGDYLYAKTEEELISKIKKCKLKQLLLKRSI